MLVYDETKVVAGSSEEVNITKQIDIVIFIYVMIIIASIIMTMISWLEFADED